MSMTHEELVRAAHTLTNVEPPADLEARIKRRLDEVAGPHRSTARWPWAAGIAAATGLVMMLAVTRSPEVPESRRPVVQGPGVQGPAASPAISASPQLLISPSAHLPISPSPHLRISPSPHLPISPSISQAELTWMARRIPALETIEALTVDQIVFDSIQPEPLSITPLTMTPLVTSPVHGDPDEGRQR